MAKGFLKNKDPKVFARIDLTKSFGRRLKFDKDCIDMWSSRLNLKIIFMTFPLILNGGV
jgi:lipopolysaccharide/colanic/teichoic acid biosynthesis glycosyltransferase